jgi:phage-related protein
MSLLLYAQNEHISGMASTSQPKPLFWMSSTQDDLRAFPLAVRQVMGYALYLAQVGDKHLDAKPLKSFAGAGVLEIVADHDGDTFRAVYTVRCADAVYA